MSDLKLAADLAALILDLHEKTLRAAEGGPEKAEGWVKLRADYVSVCTTGAAVIAAALQDLLSTSAGVRGMREALESIRYHSENQDMSHLTFRIKARECADAAIEKATKP